MKQKYGQPYVAVGFEHGKGEVIHFISHLELQRTEQRSHYDKGDVKEFLKKMNLSEELTPAEAMKQLDGIENVPLGKLEAAYSSLNVLAHLCMPTPILGEGTKSVLWRKGGKSTKSATLL